MVSKPKLLVCELWGIGDLTLATTLIDPARAAYEVHLLGKPHARELLQPTYPDVIFHEYVAPWTAHYRKYHVWNWVWAELVGMLADLRRERFDVAVSVRPDPRDHFLMWLSGAKRRIGFPVNGSDIFLNERLHEPKEKWHRVESYRALGRNLGLDNMEQANPRLEGANYRSPRVNQITFPEEKPVVTVHFGAAQPVRRWPESYWNELLHQLRGEFDFYLLAVTDRDRFGNNTRPLADEFIEAPNLHELVNLMARSGLVLCHDSGPMHVAAACGVPTTALFGPGEWRWFRPWGESHQIVRRDICPCQPCFDFCRFPENYCLTKMLPAQVWPEVERHLRKFLTGARVKPNSSA